MSIDKIFGSTDNTFRLLLTGESGVGKSTVATSFWNKNVQDDVHCFYIDCENSQNTVKKTLSITAEGDEALLDRFHYKAFTSSADINGLQDLAQTLDQANIAITASLTKIAQQSKSVINAILSSCNDFSPNGEKNERLLNILDNPKNLVIIDSLSTLSRLGFAAASLNTKDARIAYGNANRFFDSFFGKLQLAKANIILTAHVTFDTENKYWEIVSTSSKYGGKIPRNFTDSAQLLIIRRPSQEPAYMFSTERPTVGDNASARVSFLPLVDRQRITPIGTLAASDELSKKLKTVHFPSFFKSILK